MVPFTLGCEGCVTSIESLSWMVVAVEKKSEGRPPVLAKEAEGFVFLRGSTGSGSSSSSELALRFLLPPFVDVPCWRVREDVVGVEELERCCCLAA